MTKEEIGAALAKLDVSEQGFNPNAASEVYVAMRDLKHEIVAIHQKEVGALDEVMDQLEGHMLGFLNRTEQKSARTDSGTIVKRMSIQPSSHDWQAFYRWIKENDGFEFLEKRIARNSVKAWMDDHEQAPPPGITVTKTWKITVNRPKATGGTLTLDGEE